MISVREAIAAALRARPGSEGTSLVDAVVGLRPGTQPKAVRVQLAKMRDEGRVEATPLPPDGRRGKRRTYHLVEARVAEECGWCPAPAVTYVVDEHDGERTPACARCAAPERKAS